MSLDFNKDFFGNDLLDASVPRMFTDGTVIYNRLAKDYKLHKKGFFIAAPSGAGKSYFLDRQKTKNWMDGDVLWTVTNAHPSGEWWKQSAEYITNIERRSDAITEEARRYGFRIIGADCNWIRPDAVVIPDWEDHKRYLKERFKSISSGNYNGGLTSDNLDAVRIMRKYMRALGKKGVPIFRTFIEATQYLENL